MALCIRPGGFSVSNKKRKRYSPIVWDRDVWDRDDRVRKLSGYSKTCSHKQFTNNFLSTGRFHTCTATRQPVVVKSVDAGHDKDCVELPDVRSCQWVHDVEEGAEKGIKVKSCQSGQPVVVKSGVSGHYAGHDKVEYENCVDVRSCRWGVDDLEEGEIRDSSVDEKGIKVVTSKMGVYNKLTSAPFVWRRREGSEGKSSESSALTHDCDMEVVGHLDSDTSVETPEPAFQGSVNMLPSCRKVNEYENLGKLGEGTYGVVYKARNKKTGEFVALKKVKMDNDSEQGFPLTALREIKILFSSHHPSVINLIEVVEGSSSDSVFLVMEHMDYDLGAVLRRRKRQLFSQSEVKCLMLQLLQGVKYLHDNRVLHRDLKTSNLLLNRRGELKICDLGMARQYGNQAKPLTQLVVTLWYRAPELLLGAKQYSTAVDMWSVGCIMAELLLNQPLFNGNDEINQIDKIFRVLGTPNETSWPGFSQLPKAKAMFVQQPYNLLRKKFPSASFTGAAPLSNAGFDLLNKLLACDPAKRITADEALNHQWFREFPLPKSKELDDSVINKLSQFCNVPVDNIITLYDVSNIWRVPLLLKEQRAHEAILKVLNLSGVAKKSTLEEWTSRANLCDRLHVPVRVAMVGKYTGLSDSYLSVLKALLHASVACRRKLTVDWDPASDLEDETEKESPKDYEAAWNLLKGADAILVPGGFGDRGVEGKILAANYARENKIPYLGICLGMQIAVVEFARSVLGLEDANSAEFDPKTRNPCVIFMPEGSKTHMGGTMRLGSRRTYFQVKDCKSAKLSFIDERHRHRYEVNPDMVPQLEKAGLLFTGRDETGQRMQIFELPTHPYYMGVKFHPEFKSRPGRPSSLFIGLIAAACGQLDILIRKSETKISGFIGRNGTSAITTYQNGHSLKHANNLLDGIYSNGSGNGLHA